MSVERVLASMRREFLLDLSDGFVYDCLDRQAEQLDMAEHRRWVLDRFSGTLCVDELHLGRFTLLLATDPLQDLPVAFALVATNDQDHMRRFLKNLKTWGLMPEVVVTDGSNLYPAVLAELWPDAGHQLCVFHVLKDINKLILDAVRRLRRGLARRGNRGRKRKPGRRPKARARRRGLTIKEKAAFVFKHRYLIVKRREKMTEQERADLATMLSYLPELATLRDFADRPGCCSRRARARRWPGAVMRRWCGPGVPGGARVGQGDRDAGGGEVRQDDRLPEEPGVPAGADEQPRGADQPQAAVPGEGAVQVAEAADDGAVRGAAAGPVVGQERAIRNRWQEEPGRRSGTGHLPKPAAANRVA